MIRSITLIMALGATFSPVALGAQDTSVTALWHGKRSVVRDIRGKIFVEDSTVGGMSRSGRA